MMCLSSGFWEHDDDHEDDPIFKVRVTLMVICKECEHEPKRDSEVSLFTPCLA